ncbi:unnamed protein product [Clavelina lepadiformis]|uniref:Uncharacterized protein n=1 Tax=Clavelina lepadiformis TaxID=159417 RepID=A0ABP0G6Q0_CLALP
MRVVEASRLLVSDLAAQHWRDRILVLTPHTSLMRGTTQESFEPASFLRIHFYNQRQVTYSRYGLYTAHKIKIYFMASLYLPKVTAHTYSSDHTNTQFLSPHLTALPLILKH